MMATSAGVEIEAKMQGGLMQGLKRSVLGGESLFVTTSRAGGSGGWVDCAARLPGDIVSLDIENDQFNISKGGWLCSGEGVELDTKWGGFRNLFGGEGGFMIHATGTGPVVIACYGALDVVELGHGEQMVVDTGHLVGFDPTVNFTTRKVAGGMMNTLKSGEGLVMEFTGPGRVLTQTRSPSELIQWLTNVLPFSRG
jgi:uncharacterized protein (TIGR00266 family)